MTDAPLTGKTIAITASRRVAEQASAFERQGARVLLAPTVRIVPVADDTELHAATDHIIAHRPDILLVTTGYGLNGWFDSARERGLEDNLHEALKNTTIMVRGAKGRGAVRALGYKDAGMAAQERTSSLVDMALERGVAGQHVVVQQHGSPDAAQQERLVVAGARVTAVVPHRWEAPQQPERVDQLIGALVAGELAAVTFTAAPAATALLEAARARGDLAQVIAAFKSGTIAAAVGPVTADPLQEVGIEPLAPERFRLGALVKELTSALSD